MTYYFFTFQLYCCSQYCTTADLVNVDLVKIFLCHLGDLGVKMTGCPGRTRTASGAGGAEGSGGCNRGKRPVTHGGKAKSKGKLHRVCTRSIL